MLLDPRSPQYLNIPLVLDAESAVVHTDIRAARTYEQEKEEARRTSDKIKAEERLPYEVKDVQNRREARRGPFVDSDLPEIIVRHPSQPSRVANTTNQLQPQLLHGPRPVVRTVQPSRQPDHSTQSGVQWPRQHMERTTHVGPLRTQQTQQSFGQDVRSTHYTHTTRPREAHSTYPTARSRPEGIRQVALETVPVETRRLPGHVAGHGMNRPTLAAIPPSSFYAAIPRAGAVQPVRQIQHPHRVPPVRQQGIPQRHPVNEASERLAQGLREEAQPLGTRHDIQLSSLTRSLLAGGGGLPAPPLIARRTVATPSSPLRHRRSTVQFDDEDLFGIDTDAYHHALQATEYMNTFEDDGHLEEGGFADGDFIEDDFEVNELFAAHSAPDLYNGGRAYREGMAGPSRERFIPANQDRAPLARAKPRRRHD